MTTYAINEELNGIEITFDSKPSAETLEALKANGYRWHRVCKFWYAKQTPERLALAQSLTNGQPAPVAKVAKADKINLDNLGSNRPASLWGADLAKAIREDLKRRGVSGVTVRSRRVTHDTGITVTIKASEADFVSIEEMKKRRPFSEVVCQVLRHGAFCGERWIYSAEWEKMTEEAQKAAYDSHIKYYANRVEVNEHHLIDCRNDYYNITTAFFEKICAVFKIANQWNYDKSDIMTDYFDVGYYLDIDIKAPEDFTPREEMTVEERIRRCLILEGMRNNKEAAKNLGLRNVSQFRSEQLLKKTERRSDVIP
jgi:hypothetical protein